MTTTVYSAALALGLAFTLGGTEAYAIPISSDDAPITVDYSGFADEPIDGLTARVVFRDFGFAYDPGDNQTSVTFYFDVFNTSESPVETSRLSGLAFNTTPNVVVGESEVSGVFNDVNSGNYPNQIGSVEFCFVDGSGSCAGGAGSGVAAGEQSLGNQATLVFSGQLTSFLFDDFYARYQSITCIENYQGYCGGSATGLGTPTTRVPTPGPLALLAAGLLGLGVFRYRQKRA
jgi:hypothetical protein